MAVIDWKRARLRGLHFCSALAISLFILLHMGNHLFGLQGQQEHIGYMKHARIFYRSGIVEPVLLALIAWQVASGLIMVRRGWSARHGRVAWLQAFSGLYLAFFLLNHVGSVIGGRTLLGLDTDFRFAAAGFSVSPWPYFFAPYYFLAVFCLFAHLGCALYWQMDGTRERARNLVLTGFLLGGAAIALAIVLSLAGLLFAVEIPASYRATFGG